MKSKNITEHKIAPDSKMFPTQPNTAISSALENIFASKRISRIILVNPPDVDISIFKYGVAKRKRCSNYPPYGLTVLAKHLRNIGIEVKIVNLNHEVLKECIQSPNSDVFDYDKAWQVPLDNAIKQFAPDIIGVSCMFTMTYSSFRNVCFRCADYGIPIAAGGVHVSNDVEHILSDIPQIKIAFLREADIAIQKFVRVVNKELPASELSQMILSDNGIRHRFLDICRPGPDTISVIPAYDLIDVSSYSDFGVIGSFYHLTPENTRFATVNSNRGCRGRCTFCNVETFNVGGVHHRHISSVVDELQLLKEKYGIGHFMWLDDDLLNDEDRAVRLFNEISGRSLNMTWDATNGVIAAACTERVIAAAVRSGCIGLHIGMESGNIEILKKIKKPGTVESFIRAANVFRKYEQIYSSVFIMIGFPGETISMIADTVSVAKRMDMDWYSIGQLQLLPGTPIYETMLAQGLIVTVENSQKRFMIGSYGKMADCEKDASMAALSFDAAFTSASGDVIPTQEQLTDIWFYMDYHLNYHRLFHEERPVKIKQQILKLKKISDIISPDHAFALYFLAYLQFKSEGNIDPVLLVRLKKQLETSPYWKHRMAQFGLSLGDLEKRIFPEYINNK